MKKAKKLLAGLLALLLTVTGVPLYGMKVQAVDGVLTEGDYRYEVNTNGNSVKITGYNGNGGDVTIPAEIKGKSVTSIGYAAFMDCSGLTNLSIPDTVTYIDDSAFEGCSGLTSLSIPDGVTSIGYYAFKGCSGLTSLSIPDGVTSIRSHAFYGCSGLTSLSIPDTVTSIGIYAFYGCSGLTSLSIPDTVTSIGIYAFYGCSGLTSLSIPDTVTSIDDYAFYGCSGLTSLSIPDTVTSIGGHAFSGCSGLTSLSIPHTVTSIGYSAFSGCSGLTSLSIPDTVTSIDSYAFSGCSSLTSLSIPDTVTSIGSYAFYGCGHLTSVTIPSTVTSISIRTFGFVSNDMKTPDFIIYGEPGSIAEVYAAKYGFPFNQPGTGGNTSGSSGTDTSQTDISTAAITLEKDSYVYDGTAKIPAVTVKLNGKTLILNTDYTVSYSNNTKVGTAKATITGKGNYKGSVTKTFTITKANDSTGDSGSSGNNSSSENNNSSGNNTPSENNGFPNDNASKQPITCKKKTYSVAYGTKPFKLKVTSNGRLTYKSSNSKIAAVGKTSGKVTIKNTGIAYITAKTKTDSVKITIKVSPAKPKVKSLSAGKDRKLTVKWAKDKKATGYQVQVSTSKNFKKNLKKQNVTKTTCTFKKLKAGSKYYVRFRSFKKSGKSTLYSPWSSPKRSNKMKQ